MVQNLIQSLLALQGIKLALAIFFVALVFIRLLFLFLFTGRILFRKKVKQVAPVPVTLVFTARNEEDKLRANLPPLLSINEAEFEVIVVDNFSQDNSLQVLGFLRERSDRLKVSMLHQDTRYSVKMAQNLAMKASGYDWVMQVPISYENANAAWISGINSALDDNKNVVIGYSGVKSGGGLASHLYQIENFWAFVKSVGFILNGLPFVYSEENVAFKKAKYFEIGGHGLKINEPYANLELLINYFIRKKTTTVLFQAATAIQKTETVTSHEYFDILKKEIRIEKHLTPGRKALMFFDSLTKMLLIPALAAVIILMHELWPVIAVVVFVLLLPRLIIVKIIQNRLNEHKIFISSLLYDLIVPYFKIFYRWNFRQHGQKQKWKIKM